MPADPCAPTFAAQFGAGALSLVAKLPRGADEPVRVAGE